MPDDKPHRTSPRVYGGFALAAGVIFAADYVTPTGYAIWLAYLGLLFATVFVEDRRAPWLVAGLNTVLVFLRVLVNPSDVSPEVALINRSFCVALLWMGSALLTSFRHVTAPIQMLTSDRLKSELLAIIVAVTGLACFSVLFLSQGDQSPFSEFLRHNVSGGMVTVVLLSVTAVGVVLARRVSDLSAVYTQALRDKEQSEERLRELSRTLEQSSEGQTEGQTPDDYPYASQKPRIPVLLVDDHVMVRQGLRSVMESLPNIEIIGEASDGHEALKLVEKRRPAVVLMDINMPRLNGIEATARIKREHPEVAVIGLSVNAESGNQEAMKNAGASMLLPKEAGVDELFNAIMSVSTEPAIKRCTHFRS